MKVYEMRGVWYRQFLLVLWLTFILPITGGTSVSVAQEVDPAEITNGERLFLETRFAQFFKTFLDNGGDTNTPLPQGDPSLNKAVNWKLSANQFADGPFAGQSMNCRSCHFVDEIGIEDDGTTNYGMRTYSDFARRSPIPSREDGKTLTVRNSPPLVNASLPRKSFFLHFDAEFTTMVDLVKGTLTGRNYGWVPGERAAAISHIARIIREDNGTGKLASSDFKGLSYSVLLTGTAPNLPKGFVLPETFRVDVANATDKEIFQAVSKLIAAYTEDLAFSKDKAGNFNLSPYDVFLTINNLPRQPRKGESDISYSKRLLRKIKKLEWRDQLRFVSKNPKTANGGFKFHNQPFVFGEKELHGLKIFFNTADDGCEFYDQPFVVDEDELQEFPSAFHTTDGGCEFYGQPFVVDEDELQEFPFAFHTTDGGCEFYGQPFVVDEDELQEFPSAFHTTDRGCEFHDQPFMVDEDELQEFPLFFEQKHHRLQPSDLVQGSIGNCIACHAAPNFTDFKFHNTGVTQAEYDQIHGPGSFAQLAIPWLGQRFQNHNEFLPATERHPQAQEPFRAIPTPGNPQLTDLGLWNIFMNSDFPKSQKHIWQMLCQEKQGESPYFSPVHFSPFIDQCWPSQLLSETVARFKTPGLRDLGHSAPYSHTGQADTLEDVIRGYIKNAELRREGELRNGDRRLKGIALTEQDIVPLVKFMKSLNEDYN